MVPHAALLSRHHMECVSFWMVVLQLTQRIRDHRSQQGSSPNSGLGGQSAADQLLPPDLAARQFPAHLQKLLQQLGISSSAALWAALKCTQVLGRLHAIDSTLSNLARGLAVMCSHSLVFLLDSTLTTLSQQLLLELQQQMQLHVLLPGVLLQWVADMPTSNSYYSTCYIQVCKAATCSVTLYHQVLQEGPASLYQHMAGRVRPHSDGTQQTPESLVGPAQAGATSAAQPGTTVSLPLDVHARQVQLLPKWCQTCCSYGTPQLAWTLRAGIAHRHAQLAMQPRAVTRTTALAI
jgi:hypothetical protein